MKLPPIRKAAIVVEMWQLANPNIQVFAKDGRMLFRPEHMGYEPTGDEARCLALLMPAGQYLPIGIPEAWLTDEASIRKALDEGAETVREAIKEQRAKEEAFLASQGQKTIGILDQVGAIIVT